MYESFFELREKPFSLLPDPEFLFMSRQHQQALTLLEYGLMNQAGFIILTGEIGSGKTTLMRHLVGRLDASFAVGLISNTHQSLGELIDWVCMAFDLKGNRDNKLEKYQSFIDFLINTYGKGRRVLLIVDEAQNLGVEKLEELRLLSNINAGKDLVLQLMLLGQPQLRNLLRQPDLEQFAQRITASYHIGPLDQTETESYIRHRIVVAGGNREIFTRDACQAVHHYSRGLPRVINLVCDTALVYAYGADLKVIDGDAIDEFVTSHTPHLVISVDLERDGRGQAPTRNARHRPDAEDSSDTDTLQDSSWATPPIANYSKKDLDIPAIAESDRSTLPPADQTASLTGPGEPPVPAGLSSGESGIEPSVSHSAPFGRTSAIPTVASGLTHAEPTVTNTLTPVVPSATPITRAHESNRPRHPAIPRITEENQSSSALGARPHFEQLPPITPHRERSRRRMPWLAVATAVALLTVLGVGALWLTKSTPDPTAPAGPTTARQPDAEHTDQRGAVVQLPIRQPDSTDASSGNTAKQDNLAGSDSRTEQSEAAPTGEIPAPLASSEQSEKAATMSDNPTPGNLFGLLRSSSTPEHPSTEPPSVDDASLGSPTGALPGLPEVMTELQTRLEPLSYDVERPSAEQLIANLGPLVQFTDGSVNLPDDGKALLSDIADVLKSHPDLDIRVIGHTDTSGSESANVSLSERRAKAVMDYLQTQQISPERITFEGRGQREPRVDAESERLLGPWINRRIEIHLTAPSTSGEGN